MYIIFAKDIIIDDDEKDIISVHLLDRLNVIAFEKEGQDLMFNIDDNMVHMVVLPTGILINKIFRETKLIK
ncbi:MAG: hypothetical protein CVU84_15235 [Firmicutes bacterium HGW-Firmicutes-1]|jgi:hypothetical protein|nr:MAG: hypothetical protein CVU84_15235 [Firmicutes bacterium HGW-Firmicutes-1]